MKKVCPKDSSHDLFITTATICQDWLVDNDGNFMEVMVECTEVFHQPSSDNIWRCALCGSEAVDPGLRLVVSN